MGNCSYFMIILGKMYVIYQKLKFTCTFALYELLEKGGLRSCFFFLYQYY